MTDAINKSLDLVPLDQTTNIIPAEQQEDKQQASDDFAYARTTLYDAVTKSHEAVEDMIMIARQSQHPKAYEVLNSAIKTMADTATGLAELQIKKQRVMQTRGGPAMSEDGQSVINNNLFVGSTAELQKMLEEMKNK